jgi:hypothetical protein
VILEVTMALTVLTIIGLLMLKGSINVLHPRQWTLQQALTDAYLTYEKAYAQRIPFDDLTATGSPWPVQPGTASQTVAIGRIPGGTPVYATLIRTRVPDSNNYPADGGSGTAATNPAAMKVWRVQSILSYQVGGRNYVKSRTVVRTQ